MTEDLFPSALVVFGLLFLGITVFCYWSPPVINDLVKRRPPGIVSWAYAVLTVVTLVLGIRVITSKPLLQLLHDAAHSIFKEDEANQRFFILLIASFVSLSFLLANLVRSYFNLHRIEDPEPDTFAIFIRSLPRRSRLVECLLRAGMISAVFLMDREVLRQRRMLDAASWGGIRVSDFVSSFDLLWRFALCFYILLLLWDIFLLTRLKLPTNGVDKKAVRAVLLWQALPVHACGVIISFLMTLMLRNPRKADLLAMPEMMIACVGSLLLLVSMVKDFHFVTDAWSSAWRSLKAIPAILRES